MTKIKKNVLILISILAAAGIAVCCFVFITPKETTLEFGMFVGSNWDVVNPHSYVVVDRAIEEFEAARPGVKVHYETGVMKGDYSEWLSQKLLTGRLPDVFLVLDEDFDKYAALGALENLNSFMEQDADFDAQAYYQTALNAGNWEGMQVAMPYETMPTLMFVNKSLLDSNNIPLPGNDWTWDDFYDICKTVTQDTDGDGLLDQFGAYNYTWNNAVYSNGAQIFNQTGTQSYFNSSKVADAVKFIKRLDELNQGYSVSQRDFDEGRVAFMPLSYANYKTYKTYPYKIKKYTSFQWDCIALPAGASGGNLSEVYTLMMGMSSQSNQKNLAWEFVKKLTYDEDIQMDIFRYSAGASVLRNVTDSQEAEKIIQAEMEDEERVISHWLLNNVIEHGAVVPKFQHYDEMYSIADSEINQILAEGKGVDSTLKMLSQRMAVFTER